MKDKYYHGRPDGPAVTKTFDVVDRWIDHVDYNDTTSKYYLKGLGRPRARPPFTRSKRVYVNFIKRQCRRGKMKGLRNLNKSLGSSKLFRVTLSDHALLNWIEHFFFIIIFLYPICMSTL